MKNIAKSAITARFSPRACLGAIGARLHSLDLLAPVKAKLRINQKTVQHTPLEKLEDALIAILAGAHGLAEINTRLRSDPALQRAFGRRSCADQSVVQATLNACSSTNVAQLMEALDAIFRRQSLALRHDFTSGLLVLDADITGMPCGKKAEGSAKGYFSTKGIRLRAPDGAGPGRAVRGSGHRPPLPGQPATDQNLAPHDPGRLAPTGRSSVRTAPTNRSSTNCSPTRMM